MSMSTTTERVEAINKDIRQQLFQKGVKGLKGLARTFQTADADGSGQLDDDEFEEALGAAGVFLRGNDLSILFRYYDASGYLLLPPPGGGLLSCAPAYTLNAPVPRAPPPPLPRRGLTQGRQHQLRRVRTGSRGAAERAASGHGAEGLQNDGQGRLGDDHWLGHRTRLQRLPRSGGACAIGGAGMGEQARGQARRCWCLWPAPTVPPCVVPVAWTRRTVSGVARLRVALGGRHMDGVRWCAGSLGFGRTPKHGGHTTNDAA